MSYNKKDIFLATMLMLFIISLVIVFTVFFKQLYYLDINYLGIDLTSGMSVETIKKELRCFNCISVDLLSGNVESARFCNVNKR